MVPSSSLPSAYSSVFSSSSVPSTSSGILSHSTGPTASFVQHTDDAPAGVSASSAPRPVNPTASSPSFPTAKELAPLEQHPLHKAWVGWRCLCFADAPPGTSSLVRMRVNETLSHVIGVHAERDSDTQSGVTTPREPLPSSRAEADGGSSAQEEGLPGGRDAGVFVERDDQTRKKSSLRDRGEEDDDREFWISARSGGERLAELVLLTQSIGGPFEDEILRFLGWHHAKCNVSFPVILLYIHFPSASRQAGSRRRRSFVGGWACHAFVHWTRRSKFKCIYTCFHLHTGTDRETERRRDSPFPCTSVKGFPVLCICLSLLASTGGGGALDEDMEELSSSASVLLHRQGFHGDSLRWGPGAFLLSSLFL